MSRDDLELFEEFEEVALNPVAWLEAAGNLYCAAKLLEADVLEWITMQPGARDSFVGPYYMLMGYAIECLIKGVSVIERRYWIENEKFKPNFKDNGGHDLNALLLELGYTYDPEREWLFRRLSAHMQWAGRYPVPKSHLKLSQCSPYDEKDYLTSYCDYDVAWINDCYATWKEKLEKASPGGIRRVTIEVNYEDGTLKVRKVSHHLKKINEKSKK